MGAKTINTDTGKFITKLDILRKKHGREKLKLNLIHQQDQDQIDARDDEYEERLIMEEMRYYENLDAEKLENEEERKVRDERLKREEERARFHKMAPLRFKMKIKYQKGKLMTKDEDNIFLKEGF